MRAARVEPLRLWGCPEMNRRNVAVIMTCHNRKEKTLMCLDALFRCKAPDGIKLELYLTDDGCADGTADLVRHRFPDAKIFAGDGKLYWSGGMRLAFNEAMKQGFDYYLWLNDDTFLEPHALLSLFAAQQLMDKEDGQEGIAVGSTYDSHTKERSYGGLVRKVFWRPFGFDLIRPTGHCIRCHTMEGNCILISGRVVETTGGIAEEFVHAMADIDYGLRAYKAGFPLGVAADFVGSCDQNSEAGTYRDKRLPFLKRWDKMMQPKGLPPMQWLILTRRHAGYLWPVYFIKPYMLLVFTSVIAVNARLLGAVLGIGKKPGIRGD